MVRGLAEAVSRCVAALRVGEDAERLGELVRRGLRGPQGVVPHGPLGPPCAPLEELLRADDDRGLDVALGATLLAWEDAPHAVDVARVLAAVDALAEGLRGRLEAAGSSAAERLAVVNAYFFDELGFGASAGPARRGGDGRLVDLLLPAVLERRRGHCVGLSTAYLAIGYRAGLPLFGVSAPGHFFVRWDDGATRHNIETTARGQDLPDEHYVARFGIAPRLVERGVYLQSLRRREVLVEILNNRANVYWDRADVARAGRDLDRIVQVSHNFARAYLGRGFMALQRGDLDEARVDLEKAVAIDPDLGRAHQLLGELHLRAGRWRAAQEALERAVEDPTNALARTNLGRLHARLGRLQEAVAWHERALAADPGCHAAWNNLGVARRGLGDVAGARSAFQEARRLAPDFLPARENLLFLARGGDRLGLTARPAFLRICRAYERRLARAEHDDELRAAYARFLIEAGLRLDRGVALAARCVRARPTPRNLELLAQALHKSGDAARARQVLEDAIAAEPDVAPRERLTRALERLEAGGEGGGEAPDAE